MAGLVPAGPAAPFRIIWIRLMQKQAHAEVEAAERRLWAIAGIACVSGGPAFLHSRTFATVIDAAGAARL